MNASGDYKISIDKLEGPEDCAKWKWHITMVLQLLQDAISAQKEAYVEWHKDDAKAASLIASALSKSVVELVLMCKNAKEIWDKLRSRFERSNTQRLNMLIETFFGVKRDDTEDISAHVAKLQKLFVDLTDELAKHEENTLYERILSTLGKDYDNFKALWDTIPTEKQSLNLLIEKLCTIELREQDINGSAAFVVSKTRKRQTSNQQLKQKFPLITVTQINGVATVALQIISLQTNSILFFYSEFDAPQVISLGKQDVKMCAYGQGTAYVQIRRNNKLYNARMDNVLHIPDASANLIFVRAIACRGYSINFSYNNVCVRKQVNGNVVMTGYVKNGLYCVEHACC
ncbi:uncharacterized protein LOC126355390 [Schistocerca gregaria]|uniref:uncharacterized protein LOC126355390 n=1 Tax=Schistocerca gregaria TaxID=7010 RepID=UPI00211E0B43|nr:uncharacterized protein LOC126355390 [Schistocerca gregaria]